MKLHAAAAAREEERDEGETRARNARKIVESLPRIAIVAASLDIFGGQSVQAAALTERLRAEGFPVIFVPVNPRFPRWLGWLRRIPWLRTFVNELLFLPSLGRLHAADVVHVFSASYVSFLLGPAPALLAARLLGKRTILHYHSGEAADHLARSGRLVRRLLRMAGEIVVPSQFLQDVFARFGYRARVIPNIIEPSDFQFRQREARGPRLLSTRNLEAHYGVESIVRAFALLRRRYPEAALLIAGEGSERPRLERLVAELALGGVRFYGAFRPEDAPRIYADADLFVNASIVDNQPVSLLEAFASGLAVVSTPTGDIAAMLEDGAAGMLVPPGDPRAIAEAIAFLVENSSRRREIVAEARRSLERFDWKRVGGQWRELYLAADASPRSREESAIGHRGNAE